MSNEEIRVKVVNTISEVTGIESEKITGDAELMDGLDISSLEIMTLLADLEKEFSTTINEDEIRDIITLDDLVECISKKIN